MRRLSQKRVRENLKSFKNKKVDYASYVTDFYLENGVAFISCKPKNYDYIINSYSVNGYEWLNERFANFIESNAYYIPNSYPIVVEICGDYTEKQKAVIEETILDYYSLKLGDKQIDLRENMIIIRQTILASLIGFLSMLLVQQFTNDTPLYDVINTFWGIFVFRIADLIFERRGLRERKLDAAQLASVKVKFSKRFIDNAVDDKTANEIDKAVFKSIN